MALREKFSNAHNLELVLDAALPAIAERALVVAGPLTVGAPVIHRKVLLIVFLYTQFLIGTFLLVKEYVYPLTLLLWLVCTILVVIILHLSGIYFLRYPKEFPVAQKSIVYNFIYREAFQLLGITTIKNLVISSAQSTVRQRDYSIIGLDEELSDSEEGKEVLRLLSESELVRQQNNLAKIGYISSFSVNEKEVVVSSLNLQVLLERKNGIDYTNPLFNGYFVSFTVPITHKAKTFISSRSYFIDVRNQIFGKTSIADWGSETSTFESNEFGKKFHVSTTDQLEARTVLTPDVMSRLCDWQQTYDQNFSCSFIGGRINILLSDSKMRTMLSVTTVDPDVLRAELLAIIKPLLPILDLLDVV